jgi:pilus assembly protein FimV
MNTNKVLFKLATIIGLALYAVTGYGLALTQAEIKSLLNQQLDVRIGLLADNKAELESLEVSLNYSAENNVSRYKLNYEVIKGDKRNYLKITTNDVIREPIIEFTLDIGWSDGHVVREYSFLIDPPLN